jgi:hypothetical protein
MREWCEAQGVPREAFEQIDFVRATRSIGAGSAANALMITEALLDLAPSLTEEGRLNAIRLYVSRLAGSRASELLCGKPGDREKKTSQDSIAALENNAMRQGGKVVVSDTDDHVIHLHSHNDDAAQHLQEVEAKAHGELQIEDLQPLYVHLMAYQPHAQEHLAGLEGDPIRKKEYTQLKQQFEELVRMAAKIKNALQQMMEKRQKEQQEQAQQPQANPETIKSIDYKSAPEGTKAKIEEVLGAPRNPGELSVPAENTKLKEASLQLKAQRQQQQGAADDIRLAREVKNGAAK